ncbi:SDR family oxidoreductase [Tengunoibacter tsumagoiensis]|uniref:Short chain dehydrogenase n=1 Tax=Tengunoibacter tsumagoiensis TaxID=2014871 RepID=A0A401ZWP8_9CHLR|nr:SDR family oxidoreductase [Tengunoibacter tsumagoiensis]GCE11339.1 short chain dehydrogenase [Tengunoibacter tsumagoiensis]
MEETTYSKVALVTGGSRGIGAATALALAEQGYDCIITYRNKGARANDVVSQLTQRGVRGLAVASDITSASDRAKLAETVHQWAGHLNALVLNASGGMEREALAQNPDYPMQINHEAQIGLLELLLPSMVAGSSLVFVTSHWAHLYGRISQIPNYEQVAASKYAGEQAIRARLPELTQRGIRLAVVTGDLIEGTITPKLLERAAPGLAQSRTASIGNLPTATDMGTAIAVAAYDHTLPTGQTIVIGGTLESLLAHN